MQTEIQELVKEMEKVDVAKYQLVTIEANELEGVFFQDIRIHDAYEHFPDILLFDATYNFSIAACHWAR